MCNIAHVRQILVEYSSSFFHQVEIHSSVVFVSTEYMLDFHQNKKNIEYVIFLHI